MIKKEKKSFEIGKREKGLKGILWDLLRLQIKISSTALITTFFLLLILQTLLPQYFRPLPGSNGIIGSVMATPMVYMGLFFLFFVVYLCTAWIFTYSYGASLKRSVTHLIHQLKQFQRGSFRHTISIDRDDELQKLSEEIITLTRDVEQQIISMRRLLNENANLITEAERAASLEERRKLARDLHDAVSQQLFAVSMSLGAMPKLLDSKPEKAKDVFKQTEKMVHQAQQELRALIMHLRPVTLEGKGFIQAIETLFEELKRKHPHLQIKCVIEELPRLDPGTEEQLFRVIQEGLSNALRHGNPEKINFHASHKGERVLLILEDDGIGFDMEKLNEKQNVSYGLRSMKERIVELGGHFTILSYPNKGTKLEFRVPIVLH
ncbi:NarL family two-component system sensor histidine kinase LiaS [Evansella vedderi]|uniref:histidine kinase n=1 Tax=Evansella vedderi TaxID=38282 RepID=A0ABT9ZY59_9BACI|nr:sensor histidine kinase [Evansella vedderi]MDQ0255413.1 NarL family two-component system sensor histidine kinase LiaS [Evansella vedderi]